MSRAISVYTRKTGKNISFEGPGRVFQEESENSNTDDNFKKYVKTAIGGFEELYNIKIDQDENENENGKNQNDKNQNDKKNKIHIEEKTGGSILILGGSSKKYNPSSASTVSKQLQELFGTQISKKGGKQSNFDEKDKSDELDEKDESDESDELDKTYTVEDPNELIEENKQNKQQNEDINIMDALQDTPIHINDKKTVSIHTPVDKNDCYYLE